MMTPIFIIIICILLMVVYVLVMSLKRAEQNTSYFINEVGKKVAIHEEQEQQYLKLKRRVSHCHTGVEHQLFEVSTLIEYCSQRQDDIARHAELSDLILLQCFLIDVLELTGTSIRNPATYHIRQQVRDKCRASSWGESTQELKP